MKNEWTNIDWQRVRHVVGKMWSIVTRFWYEKCKYHEPNTTCELSWVVSIFDDLTTDTHIPPSQADNAIKSSTIFVNYSTATRYVISLKCSQEKIFINFSLCCLTTWLEYENTSNSTNFHYYSIELRLASGKKIVIRKIYISWGFT